jgi:hypothetical protein
MFCTPDKIIIIIITVFRVSSTCYQGLCLVTPSSLQYMLPRAVPGNSILSVHMLPRAVPGNSPSLQYIAVPLNLAICIVHRAARNHPVLATVAQWLRTALSKGSNRLGAFLACRWKQSRLPKRRASLNRRRCQGVVCHRQSPVGSAVLCALIFVWCFPTYNLSCVKIDPDLLSFMGRGTVNVLCAVSFTFNRVLLKFFSPWHLRSSGILRSVEW